jgi:MoxR-like ATPase
MENKKLILDGVHLRSGSASATICQLYKDGKTAEEIITATNKTRDYVKTTISWFKKRVEEVKGTTTTKFVPTDKKIILETLNNNIDVSEFIDDMKQYVPAENGYIDTKGYMNRLKRYYNFNLTLGENKGEKLNVLLLGETGTGKTQLAISFAHKNYFPACNVTFTGSTQKEELIGFWKIGFDEKGNRTQIWQDGIITKFAKNGGLLILDELNACPPEIAFCIFDLLSKTRSMTLLDKGGEVVKGDKKLFIIATMNENYAGTNELNVAFDDRFGVVWRLDYDDKVEKELIRQGKANDKLVILAKLQRKRYKKGEFTKPISTRAIIVHKQMEDIEGEQKAIENLFSKFSATEKQALMTDWEMVTKNEKLAEELIKETDGTIRNT